MGQAVGRAMLGVPQCLVCAGIPASSWPQFGISDYREFICFFSQFLLRSDHFLCTTLGLQGTQQTQVRRHPYTLLQNLCKPHCVVEIAQHFHDYKDLFLVLSGNLNLNNSLTRGNPKTFQKLGMNFDSAPPPRSCNISGVGVRQWRDQQFLAVIPASTQPQACLDQ